MIASEKQIEKARRTVVFSGMIVALFGIGAAVTSGSMSLRFTIAMIIFMIAHSVIFIMTERMAHQRTLALRRIDERKRKRETLRRLGQQIKGPTRP